MPITAADIRREVKEKKCNLYSSYVFRYFGNNEKTSKFLLQMNN